MSPKEHRAYRLGFLRALQKARSELHAMGQRLDDEPAELADEMQGMRNEYRRWQAVERAIAIKRDPDILLN
jgi:hypothetical protein